MPFTLAHPIAILPIHWLTRGRLSLTALAIGAMVPDVSYFVWLRPTGELGHTWFGVLVQGLPAGVALYVVWIYGMRAPMLATLPRWLARRMRPEPEPRTWSRWAGVAAAIALGAVTHITWDSFTHETGWAVARWGWLRASLGPLPVYRWGQYAGGVLGLVGLGAAWSWALARRTPREIVSPAMGAGVRLGATLWVVGAMGAGVIAVTGQTSWHVWVVRAVIAAMSGAMLGTGMYAMLWWWAWRRHRVVWA